MEKPILTEEQARIMYRDGHKGIYPSRGCENDYISKLKQLGYIRKTAVEEAEEMYQQFRKDPSAPYFKDRTIEKQHEALKELMNRLDGEQL